MDTVSISMASIPPRCGRMLQTVKDFAPRCDNLFVTLDGYAEIPVELAQYCNVHPLITPCIGPRAKFSRVGTVTGHHLMMDDDILYPADYVDVTVRYIDLYRDALIGYHANIVFRHFATSDIKLMRIEFSRHHPVTLPVHMLGTGTLAFHSDRFQLNHEAFEPGMDDEQLAIYCQRNRIPMLVMPHAVEWMQRATEVDRIDALCRNPRLRAEAAQRIRGWPNWNLYYCDSAKGTPICPS